MRTDETPGSATQWSAGTRDPASSAGPVRTGTTVARTTRVRTTRADVTALASILGELASRATELAETAQLAGQDELSSGLFAVERDLKSALRRLTRTARPSI